MSIKTKTYTVSASSDNYLDHAKAYLKTAGELMGGDWEYLDSTPGMPDGYDGPSLRIKTTNGYYGIVMPKSNNQSPIKAIIADRTFSLPNQQAVSIFPGLVDNSATCAVWSGDGGSVGFGGMFSKPSIRVIMAKFDGNEQYAIGATSRTGDVTPSLLGDAGQSIGPINTTRTVLGSGVYLHSLLDPTSGDTCSDVFGVQCFDSSIYKACGTTIKQGGSSYISVLGDHSGESLHNIFFIKM